MEEEPFILAKDLLRLAERVKEELPFSASMYNSLLFHARNHAQAFTFYTLRGRPHAHVVMWINKSKTEIGVHAKPEEIHLLKEALTTTQLLAWQSQYCFFAVQDYLTQTIQDVAENRAGKPLILSGVYTFVRQDEASPPLRCTPGLRVCKLGRAGVAHMLATNNYHKDRDVDEILRLATRVSSAGVYEDESASQDSPVSVEAMPLGPHDRIPLAWVSCLQYGALASLMTEQEHRRKGLAQLVVEAAGRVMATQGYVPHAYVETDNEPSFKMFSRMAGWERKHDAIFMHT
ncbi:uncharacterized protein LOC122264565 isoform X2 [Penaeus japonicus]|uniref:uncharacterized protein LOC122264565 isoform X2 n=1 Tax=Penaeus japonicus TaxID=27405 RepID=UPI001C71233F|nr:uncharacterized protein LOC122264565 isoform X2 [Penaeus japonicus]